MLPVYVLAMSLALVGGATPEESSCEDDMVLLQVSHQMASAKKTSNADESLDLDDSSDLDEDLDEPVDPDEPLDPYYTDGPHTEVMWSFGPEGHGLCGWASVFGPSHPSSLLDVKTLFETACLTLYSQGLCTSMTGTLFSAFDDGDDFESQVDLHPLLCREISELIQASDSYQEDLAGDGADQVTLLNKLNKRSLSTRGDHSGFEASLSGKNNNDTRRRTRCLAHRRRRACSMR